MEDTIRQKEFKRWYEGEEPKAWKKSDHAIFSDFIRAYLAAQKSQENPR